MQSPVLVRWLMLAIVSTGCQLGTLTCLGQDAWGHLSGRMVVEGELPKIPAEIIDKDEATCMVDGKAPLDDNLMVDKDGGLADVFIMMFLDRGDAAPAIHPSYLEKKETSIVLDNIQCRFVPHALFVQTGQKLSLKNSDDVGHNCHIITFGNEENVNLAANGSVDIKLNKADKVPGNVVCDIHKWMDAVILVRDEPYAVISATDGTFNLENIPAGNWKFQFWHKKVGFLKDLKIGDKKTGRRGEMELTIQDGETTDLGKIVVQASDLAK